MLGKIHRTIKTNDIDFTHRYLPNTKETRQIMLEKIGIKDINELFADIPDEFRLEDFDVFEKDKMTEAEVAKTVEAMLQKNVDITDKPFFLGGGIYNHHIPSIVDTVISRSEFLTAYTPYQPEVSQGTLTTIFEFQSMVSRVTGMEVTNASMYDGSTAFGEAVLMAFRVNKKKKKAIISGNVHPQYAEVINTMTKYISGVEVIDLEPKPTGDDVDEIIKRLEEDDDIASVLVQNPSFFGHLYDLKRLADVCKKKKVLLIVGYTEFLALGALESYGAMGADIVVGEGQSLGIPMSFGGPSLGILSTKSKYIRQLPGRIVGATTTQGENERAFVLTLGTREQHIRREKATSNICTSSGLNLIAFTVTLAAMGEIGFRNVALKNHENAQKLARKITETLGPKGVKVLNESYFNEFTVDLGRPAAPIVEDLASKGVFAGIPVANLYEPGKYGDKLDNLMVVACTEKNTEEDMDKLVGCLEKVL